MFDAFFFVSFGGPEGPDDVMPFLDNVLRGKNVPEERKQGVAQHYLSFGGVSPINAQNRELIQKLEKAFEKNDIDLPIYWGNRNWNPTIQESLESMKTDGKKHALAYFTSAFSSYSGCRQYRENIAYAQEQVGQGAPEVSKLRMYFNHPLFIQSIVENMQKAYQRLLQNNFDRIYVLFTAHSIPISMSDNCDYVKQLNEACLLVSKASGFSDFKLVYQSRSGPPQVPWLEPDVCDELTHVKEKGFDGVLVCPIGFVSDHMEVIYDLDHEAKQKAEKLELGFERASAAGHNDLFVDMIVELVKERLDESVEKRSVGQLGPWHDECPVDCCQYKPRRPGP